MKQRQKETEQKGQHPAVQWQKELAMLVDGQQGAMAALNQREVLNGKQKMGSGTVTVMGMGQN